jgi:hypothetical protein
VRLEEPNRASGSQNRPCLAPERAAAGSRSRQYMRQDPIAGGFGESREGVRGEDTRTHEGRHVARGADAAIATQPPGVGSSLPQSGGRDPHGRGTVDISMQSKRELHECKAHGSRAT